VVDNTYIRGEAGRYRPSLTCNDVTFRSLAPSCSGQASIPGGYQYPDTLPPTTRSGGAQRWLCATQRAEAVEHGGMFTAVEQSLARSYPERFRSDRQRFEQYRRRWLANDPEGCAAINRMLTEMDLSQQYSRIACPTLVIGCRYDTIRPPHEVELIARQIPGARYVETASGHCMPHQTPKLFLETVLPFLQEP
jgi:pimeloyl-ACP methyl ester carboxylesterase